MIKRIIAAIILSAAIVVAVLVWINSRVVKSDLTELRGFYVECNNGSKLFVNSEHIILLHNNEYANLTSGDGIIIGVSELTETMPETAETILVKKDSDGYIENIPEDTINLLGQMGYQIINFEKNPNNYYPSPERTK